MEVSENLPVAAMGGFGYPFKTKADEVRELMEIAQECGYEKDKILFEEMLNTVYRGI